MYEIFIWKRQISEGNPVKSNFQFRFSWNRNKKFKFQFQIDQNWNLEINIPVLVSENPFLVLKTPFRSYTSWA